MVRTEGEKTKTLRMGVKAENVEKMSKARERGEREWGLSHKTGRRQSRRREGNRKESEMNGEGCEEGGGESGSQEEGTRGCQSSVEISCEQRRSGVCGLTPSPYRNLVGPGPQVCHVNQQVDDC